MQGAIRGIYYDKSITMAHPRCYSDISAVQTFSIHERLNCFLFISLIIRFYYEVLKTTQLEKEVYNEQCYEV